jgi:hypothetical protein
MSFKSVQKQIAAKEHVPLKNAGAILADSTRNASAAAKRKNPNLEKVKGSAHSRAVEKMNTHGTHRY